MESGRTEEDIETLVDHSVILFFKSTFRRTWGSKLMDKNPLHIVETMKVKNGIQMDGMHRIANGETDLFEDPLSYNDAEKNV